MRLAWLAFGILVVTWLPLFGIGYSRTDTGPMGLVLLAMLGVVGAGVLLLAGVLRSGRRKMR